MTAPANSQRATGSILSPLRTHVSPTADAVLGFGYQLIDFHCHSIGDTLTIYQRVSLGRDYWATRDVPPWGALFLASLPVERDRMS